MSAAPHGGVNPSPPSSDPDREQEDSFPSQITMHHHQPTFDYARIQLQPATQTKVVTTTTTTTVEFAPILVPKSRALQPRRSSFSFPHPSYPAPHHCQEPTEASTSAAVLGTHLRDIRAAEDRPLELDPRLYPLSTAKWPATLNSFRLALGDLEGRFAGGEETEQDKYAHSGLSAAAKGKQSVEGIKARAHNVGGVAGGSPRRGTRRGRVGDGPGATVNELGGVAETETGDGYGLATSPLMSEGRLSPGPPRKRHRPSSAEPDQSTGADLLSDRRGLRPPSPVPTSGGESDSDDERNTAMADDEPDSQASLVMGSQLLDIGDSGLALSSLLSLPDMVNSFDALPQSLQSYVLFNFLRRAPVPVLQTVNNLVGPALRRDFLVDLPPELSLHVLGFLDGPSLGRAASVSRSWRRLIDGEWRVWKSRLIQDGLWIGDGSEEREALQIASGSSETLFLRRLKTGVWDDDARPSQLDDESMHVDGAGPATPRRHSLAGAVRPASPSSSREESPPPAETPHVTHMFKRLYLRRSRAQANWRTREPVRTHFVRPNNNVVTCLQFDKDKVVTASDENSINVFDTHTGNVKARLDAHDGGVWALQYVGNILVSGSTDRTVRVWNLDTGKCTHTFVGHTSTVRCLQIIEPVNINPDPKGEPVWEPPYPMIVTGSRDWTLRVWRLPQPGKDPEYHPESPVNASEEGAESAKNPYHLRQLTGHKQAVRALAAHGRTIVSASYDNRVLVWDAMTGECRHKLKGHDQRVYSVVYDPVRQQCASGSMDGTVKLWDTQTGVCLATLDGHSSLVGLLGLSQNHLVSAAADSTLRIWDPATGDHRHTLAAHSGAITCFAHDDWKVVSGSDGTLKMWDVKTGALERDLVTGLTGVWQVSFDQRFCVAAVQRNGQSEFEILDFGAVDVEEWEQDKAEAEARRLEGEAVLTIEDDEAEEDDEVEVLEAGGSGVPLAGRIEGSTPVLAARTAARASRAPRLLGSAEFPRNASGPGSATALTSRTVRRTSSWRALHPAPAAGGAGASRTAMTTPVGGGGPPPLGVRAGVPRFAGAADEEEESAESEGEGYEEEEVAMEEDEA